MSHDEPLDAGPVRPGEELPWDRLVSYLGDHLGVAGPLRVRQFPNGAANLTYWLAIGDQRFVLRRPPFGQIAPGAHDMRREHRVLSRLWRVYDRAPRAHLFCDDHSVIGSDFVVMDYRQGDVVWGSLPPSMAELPGAGRQIGLAVVDAMADLHAVEPAACDLADLGRPDGFVNRQLAGWRQRWDLVATPDHDDAMADAAAMLAARRPASPDPTLVHNDLKVDNCQFQPGRPERVTSVFDWDMATLGDPLVDLGTLLNYWPDPSDTEWDRSLHFAGLEHLGLPTRAEVVARYHERTGIAVGDVTWYEAFACWKSAVVLQQLWQRAVRGETKDPRMAERGAKVGPMAARALRILRGQG